MPVHITQLFGQPNVAVAAAETQADLTDNSTGTASATDEIEVVGVTNTGDVSGAINNNNATFARELAAAKADNAALRAEVAALNATMIAAGIMVAP